MIFLLVHTLLQMQRLEVGEIEMKGQTMECSKGVFLEQKCGAFKADHLSIALDENAKPIAMDGEGSLELKLKNGGILKAPFASFDGIGKLSSWHGTDLFKVEYNDPVQGFHLKCGKMELELIEETPWTGKITAFEQPEMETPSGDRVLSERMVFQGIGKDGKFSSVLLQGRCVVVRPSGDQIAANEVALDLKKRSAHLSGESVIRLVGKTVRKISTFGSVLLTEDKVVIESPVIEGTVPEEKQLHIEDELGDLYADRAELDYEEKNGKRTPKILLLNGNLRLLYKEQYALAEEGEVDFATGTLYLKSPQRGQVLFYDRLNHIQGAAEVLKVSLDPTTRKVKVEAIGKMRISLNESELAELKKRMALDGF